MKNNKSDLNIKVISEHDDEEEASHYLTSLAKKEHINIFEEGRKLTVYEDNYFLRNKKLYQYQILSINGHKVKENFSIKKL